MIVVRISQRGVEAAEVLSVDDAEEDRDLRLWPLVRTELDRLHERIRLEGPGLLGGGAPPPVAPEHALPMRPVPGR
jgi:hypothetical protein